MAKASCFLPEEVKTFLIEEAERKGILVSKHIASLLIAYYYGRQQPVDTVPAGGLNN